MPTVKDKLAAHGVKTVSVEPPQEAPEPWEEPASFTEHDLPKFPVEALPAWLREFVVGLARETQTPVDMSALLSLAACSATVAGNVEVEARRGWREPINLYTIVAIPPANRKSAVVSDVVRPLESVEASLISDMRLVVERAESERRMLAARVELLEKAAAKGKTADERQAKRQQALDAAEELAKMEVPKMPRLLVDDATPETLSTILNDQDGRIALFSPEGDLFDIMAGRYSNGSPNIGVFLKGHSGDSLRVDRRGRSEYVKRPSVTIGLAVQPDVIRGLVTKPSFKGRGLLGRFLYSLPASTLGSRSSRVAPLDEEARAEYGRNLKAMAGLTVSFDGEGARMPHMLRLSAESDDYLAEFQDEIEPQLVETGALGTLSDWAGKLAGAVLRIAAVIHLAEHAGHYQNWPERIAAGTIKRAIEIGRYLIPHAQAAYAEMGADPAIEAAMYVLRWIEKAGVGCFTQRDVYQATKGRFKKVETLVPVLELLESQNYIRALIKSSQSRRGRKASQLYEVNPIWMSPAHNSQDSHNSTQTGISGNCGNSGDGHVNGIFKTPLSLDSQSRGQAREEFEV